jgi:pantothenate kinase
MAQHSHVHKNVVQAACVLIAPCAPTGLQKRTEPSAPAEVLAQSHSKELKLLHPADGFNGFTEGNVLGSLVW